MPETDLPDSPKQADSKLSSIGAPPKQPDTRGPPSDFVVTELGPIDVKGFGRVLVHVIEDERGRGKAGR